EFCVRGVSGAGIPACRKPTPQSVFAAGTMYQAYWQLDCRPFESTGDDRFHYAAESQRGALLKLRYVLENRRGAAVLAGESGLGKTLLVQKLLSELDESFAPRVHLVFPQMPADQLLTYLSDQLTGQSTTPSERCPPLTA